MNVSDPNDFVDVNPNASFTPRRRRNASSDAKQQIYDDESRTLDVASSMTFTRIVLGVTLGLLLFYVVVGPPPEANTLGVRI